METEKCSKFNVITGLEHQIKMIRDVTKVPSFLHNDGIKWGGEMSGNQITGSARHSWLVSCLCVQSAARLRTSSPRQSSRTKWCGRSPGNLPRHRPERRNHTLQRTLEPGTIEQRYYYHQLFIQLTQCQYCRNTLNTEPNDQNVSRWPSPNYMKINAVFVNWTCLQIQHQFLT